MATLDEKPDDPAANLLLGKHFCFVAGQWEEGFAYLAKLEDKTIQELATASLADPQTPNEQTALADLWWSKAERPTILSKREIQFVALHWYQLAQPKLDGLAKARVDKRITDGQDVLKSFATTGSGQVRAMPSRLSGKAAGNLPKPAAAAAAVSAPPAATPAVVSPLPKTTTLGNPPPAVKAPFSAAQARTAQQAWAKHLKTAVEAGNTLGMRLVLVPPGEFQMGSTDQQIQIALAAARQVNFDQRTLDRIRDAERPQHRVVLTKPSFFGATEVTVGQFARFVTATGYVTDAERYGYGSSAETAAGATVPDTAKGANWRAPGYTVTNESPVTQVSWNDATAFCTWLSQVEKFAYRLPTEAEWEFACRAGTSTLFWCGDDPVQLAQVERCGGGGNSQSVGMMRPNPFGLFDMHGNVNEWCQDLFDMKWYEKSPVDDPSGPGSGTWRVVRGGFSSTANAAYCRSAFRNQASPAMRNGNIGFRVVCVP